MRAFGIKTAEKVETHPIAERSRLGQFIVQYDAYRRDREDPSGRLASAVMAHRDVRRMFRER